MKEYELGQHCSQCLRDLQAYGNVIVPQVAVEVLRAMRVVTGEKP